jgi:hypothetical protein
LRPSQGVTVSDQEPPSLGKRGTQLWRDLGRQGTFDPSERVLIEEACRIVDRLDRLDDLISGDADSWLSIIEQVGNPESTKLVINAPLAEARQQALALKQIFTELRQMRGQAADPDAAGGGSSDELAAQRAKRLANTAGMQLPAL